MPVRHIPFWLDRHPKSRRPSHPPLRGDAAAGAVIIGAGLTGCACAAVFAAAGVNVTLLDAAEVGAGATSADPGVVREGFDASFREGAAALGRRGARPVWQAMQRGGRDLAATLKRLRIRCDLEDLDLLHIARGDSAALRREYQARRDAGLEHRWVAAPALTRQIAAPAGGAIRTRGFGLDPYRASLGLAAAAVSRGAVIHERSPVTRIRHASGHVDVTTPRGTVRADVVVVATSALPDLRALRRHLQPATGYAVVTEPLPSAVRRELGARGAALQDDASPPHVLRWLPGDRILFSGGDQPAVPPRLHERTLIQRTGQLMYELSTLYPVISGLQPAWSWSFTTDRTVDGLPFVGPHRNFPRHLFAVGGARHGAGLAWAAARLLLRHYQGAPAKGDDLFAFTRVL